MIGKVYRHRRLIVVALAILVPLMAPADVTADSNGGLTLEQVAMMRSVGEVAISPNGDYIAYTLSVPRNPFAEEDGSAWKELHLVGPDGKSHPYVTGEVKVGTIKWTPDGTEISYLAERGDDTTKVLYVIPLAGGESRKVIEFPTSISSYSWAPDGRQVAFLAEDTLSEHENDLRDIGFEPKVYEEDWRLVRVWLVDASDSSAEPHPLDLPGSASSMEWSPRGDRIALALAPTPLIDHRYMYRKVTIIDPAQGRVVHQFDTPGKLGSIEWSPDGEHLAIITAADLNDPSAGELVVSSVDGGPLKPLITGYDGHVRRIAWPDNKSILFLAEQGVQSTLGKVAVSDARVSTLLTTGPVFKYLSLSTDGKSAALSGSSPSHPGEVFKYTVGKDKAERVTNSNPFLAEVRLSGQEIIEHTARDGLNLQGLLIYPLDYVEGERYPLILQVHGGPEGVRQNGWLTWYSSPGQAAAARGFAVFVPNYRGSTGRGVEFSKMGQSDYAGGEFNDLVDAVDHLVDIGLVDRDRVGITGGSYGGYASAWGATALTEHFAASVMIVGISDLISKFGTTDIPQEMYEVHARRWPWDYWQWYLERSPIYHAAKARTPILIMHGEDDTRVHPSQSMELYRYLKTHGNVPVRMVFYPDEGHGNRQAASRYDCSVRLLRWMEHYLMGEGGDPPPYEIDYSPLEEMACGE
ncbi:MAG: S9 family peptidase [Candidatus Zixiibacteriota bacterium]|nr:MAG: S9 family peptidase [candidate division Zixibacteria bacterium]